MSSDEGSLHPIEPSSGSLHVLLLGDSLAFHGPDGPHAPDDPRLYPNRMAAAVADAVDDDVRVDLVARLGWTARDVWWALTKDPSVWGLMLPRADALVLGVGGMDHLPAAVPTWARDAIPYVRPGAVRRRVRDAYRAASPRVIRATGGRLRQLPQVATDHYLTRVVQGVRTYRPGIPVVLMGPSPHAAPSYPSHRHHVAAVTAGRRWAEQHDAAYVDVDPPVLASIAAGAGNPDGMHWGWDAHDGVGRALGAALAERLGAAG